MRADIETSGNSSSIKLYNHENRKILDYAGSFNVFETKQLVLSEIEKAIDLEIDNMLTGYSEIKKQIKYE